MDLTNTYFVRYFFLLLICFVMGVNSIVRYKNHPRISTFTIIIISAALVLSIAKSLEDYGKAIGSIALTTLCSFLSYVLNTTCIVLFVLMTGEIKTKKHLIIVLIPLIINFIVYLLMFIPGANHAVVYFELGEGTVHFHGGPLRFTSHIISALYLIYIMYLSFRKISSNHIMHGLTIIVCAIFVVTAVVVESFFNDSGEITILSTTIAFSATVYNLYLYMEDSQVDVLT